MYTHVHTDMHTQRHSHTHAQTHRYTDTHTYTHEYTHRWTGQIDRWMPGARCLPWTSLKQDQKSRPQKTFQGFSVLWEGVTNISRPTRPETLRVETSFCPG